MLKIIENCIAIQQSDLLNQLIIQHERHLIKKHDDIPVYGKVIMFKNAPEEFKELLLSNGFKIIKAECNPDKWKL